jgi:hypothetical protein
MQSLRCIKYFWQLRKPPVWQLRAALPAGDSSGTIRPIMTETEAPPAPASRRSRRRRHRAASPARFWRIGGVVLVCIAGLFMGIKLWIKSYLQSDKFRHWISGEMAQRLHADVHMDRIEWQDSTASVGSFTAVGEPGAVFAKLEARDLRAVINTGAVWDRVWQVDEIKVARFHADLSSTSPDSTNAPPENSAPAPASSGFLASLLPNRTQVKGIRVDEAGFTWKGKEHSAEAVGIALNVKPSDGHEFYLASGTGGTLHLSMLPDTPVELRSLEASHQGEEIALEDFRAEAAGADVTVEGTVTTGDSPLLDLSGTVAGLDLARIEPENWLKSLQGRIGGAFHVSGDARDVERLNWRGSAHLRDGLLEGLPLLHVIARKTRNEGFIRLVLKDARTDFTRTGEGGWLLEKLTLDAPGLLRLKGNVACTADESLQGEFLLGIVPGTLRYLAGAEQQVFLPLDQLLVTNRERALITQDDAGLLWTRFKLGGTLDNPQEDISDRLAKAWFNATVDEVMNMSMEGAVKAAETASRLAGEAAGQVIEKAPDILENGLKTGTDLLQKGVENGGDLLEKGVEGGLKAVEGLIPR